MKRRMFGHLSTNDGVRTRVEVVGVYDPDEDPYRLTLVIRDRRRHQVYEWRFGRDLLAAGLGASLDAPAGVGHVRLWFASAPSGRSWVVVQLLGMREETGMAAWLELGAADVAGLVDALYEELPAGAEEGRVDWDAVVERILARSAR